MAKCKKVGQYDLKRTDPCGVGRLLIKVWNSQKEASETLGIAQPSISDCCYGKVPSAGGYKWSFYIGGKNASR